MRAFLVVWAGQLISVFATAMTQFGLVLWVYEQTGEATSLALQVFFSFLPGILVGPIAGALVDRWNRKLVLILSDLGAGVSTIVLLILYSSGNLQIWHLYAAGAFASVFAAFQWPAYSAAISTMLPAAQYGRANGLIGLLDPFSTIFAAPLATILLIQIGLNGIFLIDIVTFIVAISAVLIIAIPQPPKTTITETRTRLLDEMVYGFHYIRQRRSLFGLQLVFTATNFAASFGAGILAAMILARTGRDEGILAAVQTMGAVGGFLSGLLLSSWGGPRRRVWGVLMGMAVTSLCSMAMGIGRTVIVWGIATFIEFAAIIILNGSNQAIWQSKVPPDVQGRVFSTRRLIAQCTIPIGILLSGPLADRVFEPAMQPDGALAPLFGWLVGTGPGAGIGLMFVIFGAIGVMVAAFGTTIRDVREVETLIPDHSAPAVPTA